MYEYGGFWWPVILFVFLAGFFLISALRSLVTCTEFQYLEDKDKTTFRIRERRLAKWGCILFVVLEAFAVAFAVEMYRAGAEWWYPAIVYGVGMVLNLIVRGIKSLID